MVELDLDAIRRALDAADPLINRDIARCGEAVKTVVRRAYPWLRALVGRVRELQEELINRKREADGLRKIIVEKHEQLQQAEADAAMLREALETMQAALTEMVGRGCDRARINELRVMAANVLATDAGRALLEELKDIYAKLQFALRFIPVDEEDKVFSFPDGDSWEAGQDACVGVRELARKDAVVEATRYLLDHLPTNPPGVTWVGEIKLRSALTALDEKDTKGSAAGAAEKPQPGAAQAPTKE